MLKSGRYVDYFLDVQIFGVTCMSCILFTQKSKKFNEEADYIFATLKKKNTIVGNDFRSSMS